MDKNELYELLEWFDRSTLSEIIVEKSDTKVVMKKGGVPSGRTGTAFPAPPPLPPAETLIHDEASKTKEGAEVVTAPMVGTFYRAAAADAPPFVEAGMKVKKGETICVIEAMKMMNELEAEFDGEIINILAQNVSLVEYGTPLFEVRRDD